MQIVDDDRNRSRAASVYKGARDHERRHGEDIRRRRRHALKALTQLASHPSGWVDARRLDRCCRLVETSDPSSSEAWTVKFSGLVEFDLVPVLTSENARARANG
jgi:hypothetical protein